MLWALKDTISCAFASVIMNSFVIFACNIASGVTSACLQIHLVEFGARQRASRVASVASVVGRVELGATDTAVA